MLRTRCSENDARARLLLSATNAKRHTDHGTHEGFRQPGPMKRAAVSPLPLLSNAPFHRLRMGLQRLVLRTPVSMQSGQMPPWLARDPPRGC
jgi:hypothetical protein